MPAQSLATWRRYWRTLGVALDKLLPILFSFPAPLLSDLRLRVPRCVCVPGDGKSRLDDDDVGLVADSAAFISGYIAEFLPAQVTMTDLKGELPDAASRLAVRNVGGEKDYLGSFDLLLRIHATSAGMWRRYNGDEVALDVKLTGASAGLGSNGPTMRTYLEHARAVMIAARQEGGRVGRCTVVAFLVRRPPGRTFDGRSHAGDYGFLAVGVRELVAWEPSRAAQPPAAFVMQGGLLRRGVSEEPEALPRAPLPTRAPQSNRWNELREVCVRPGWVIVQDFCSVFGLGPRNLKKGAERVLKRLREAGEAVEEHRVGNQSGRPPKIDRVSALRRVYTTLK